MTWNLLVGNTRGIRDDDDMARAVGIVSADVGCEARKGGEDTRGLLVALMRDFRRRRETTRTPRRANML